MYTGNSRRCRDVVEADFVLKRKTLSPRRKAQRMTENDIGKIVVDECIQLHRALGPGLLEIVYEVTLARRLEKMGLNVVRQVNVPIEFEGEKFDERAAWGGVLPLLCL